MEYSELISRVDLLSEEVSDWILSKFASVLILSKDHTREAAGDCTAFPLACCACVHGPYPGIERRTVHGACSCETQQIHEGVGKTTSQ